MNAHSKQITVGMYATPDARLLLTTAQNERMATITIPTPWRGRQQPVTVTFESADSFTAYQLRRIADLMDAQQDPTVPPYCHGCGASMSRADDGSLTCLGAPTCTPSEKP